MILRLAGDVVSLVFLFLDVTFLSVYIALHRPPFSPLGLNNMSSPAHHSLRFTSAVKVSEGAHAIIARDRARAQKLLAGIQPHGPNAHKTLELRRRVTHHTHGHHSQEVINPLSRDATGDTIDVTDAGLFTVSSSGLMVLIKRFSCDLYRLGWGR